MKDILVLLRAMRYGMPRPQDTRRASNLVLAAFFGMIGASSVVYAVTGIKLFQAFTLGFGVFLFTLTAWASVIGVCLQLGGSAKLVLAPARPRAEVALFVGGALGIAGVSAALLHIAFGYGLVWFGGLLLAMGLVVTWPLLAIIVVPCGASGFVVALFFRHQMTLDGVSAMLPIIFVVAALLLGACVRRNWGSRSSALRAVASRRQSRDRLLQWGKSGLPGPGLLYGIALRRAVRRPAKSMHLLMLGLGRGLHIPSAVAIASAFLLVLSALLLYVLKPKGDPLLLVAGLGVAFSLTPMMFGLALHMGLDKTANEQKLLRLSPAAPAARHWNVYFRRTLVARMLPVVLIHGVSCLLIGWRSHWLVAGLLLDVGLWLMTATVALHLSDYSRRHAPWRFLWAFMGLIVAPMAALLFVGKVDFTLSAFFWPWAPALSLFAWRWVAMGRAPAAFPAFRR